MSLDLVHETFTLGIASVLVSAAVAQRRMLIGTAAQCTQCGYPIHTEQPSRCPECGTVLAAHRFSPARPGRPLALYAIVVAGLLFGALALASFPRLRDVLHARLPGGQSWAVVYVEHVQAGGIDRIVVASPPGMTEVGLGTPEAHAVDMPQSIEVRVHHADGRVDATAMDKHYDQRGEIRAWFAEVGADESLEQAVTERGDPAWRPHFVSDRLREMAMSLRIRDDLSAKEDRQLDDAREKTLMRDRMPKSADTDLRVITPRGVAGRPARSDTTYRWIFVSAWLITTLGIVEHGRRWRDRALD